MVNKLILIVHILLITFVSLTVRSPFVISQEENLPLVQTFEDEEEDFSAYTICTQPTINQPENPYFIHNPITGRDITIPEPPSNPLHGSSITSIHSQVTQPTIDEPEKPYSICNPITGKHITVPEPPSTPHHESPVTGLGFDPISKVFKFIRMVDDSGYRDYRGTYLQIYNFKTRNWTVEKFSHGFNYQDICQSPDLGRYGQKVSEINRFAHVPNTFLNGSFHWMLYPYINFQMKIVTFDIHSEKFGEIPMPLGLDLDPVESRPEFMYLGMGIPSDWRSFQHYLLVLDERLALVHHVNDEHVEIWVMNEYGVQSSWEKKYVIGKINGPFMPVKLTYPVTEGIGGIESMISEEQPTVQSRT